MEQWLNMLDAYIADSLPHGERFITRSGLSDKVDQNGRFKIFTGNTVVFLLDQEQKAFLKSLQDELYARAGFALAQRLDSSTFHMTAHDLCNSGTVRESLPEAVRETTEKALEIVNRYRLCPPLRLETTWLFNMVNTSVVLGLKPADDAAAALLSNLYRELEEILPLGYALTPHITMAYYKPGFLEGEALERLRSALHPVHRQLVIPMENLAVQNFQHMNCYETVRSLE